MPEKKTTGKNPPKGNKQSAAKKQNKDGRRTEQKPTPAPSAAAAFQPRDISRSVFHQVFPYVMVLFAVFIVICFVAESWTGVLGKAMRTVFYGLFAGASFSIPVMLVIGALQWKKDAVNRTVLQRFIFAAAVLLCLSVVIHVVKIDREAADSALSLNTLSPKLLWTEGGNLHGGGVIGGWIAVVLYRLVGFAGSMILSCSLLFIFAIFLCGLTPKIIFMNLRDRAVEHHAVKKAEKAERKRLEAEYRARLMEQQYENSFARESAPPEEPIVEQTGGYIDPQVFDDIYNDKNGADEADGADADRDGRIDLNAIFTEGDGVELPDVPDHVEMQASTEISVGGFDTDKPYMISDEELDAVPMGAESALTVTREKILPEKAPKSKDKTSKAEPDKPKKPIYRFPPLTLLNLDTSNSKNVDVSEELRTNATKLVETLNSFKVRTKILNVTRGPTITRYELAPEEGVRVRSILNLVDDISLNLATTGVRIEAPIPGKKAVGIEVPNRKVSTVYLRELLENREFKDSDSRVTVSLGVNVSNEPIFVDIARMPHLLIAGATGMGKSVCINSMIVSLLYKATPDEVKLILIDPKKVELNIYNGLPHLLVPVVSDPKKAAGSLHWAVTEMERRFEMIEEAGVRDIKGYNAVVKEDPTLEFMPQVVIIIDELADLMMTAPDDVEDSICRLAQKARAAGMHLIIGTQRPSVDVITGLIKANVPSRIAFTVASQVDSRTIIDIAGAEKLIGRGDMLYAPVGAAKPGRVQGAFVSEQEVLKVCEFIKSQAGATYDDAVIDSIEQAAARCGQGKKGAAAANMDDYEGGEEGDNMLKPAIELAIEAGKISTSLIQRKLSLGYGRAAKLIDEMEERGIVGPRNGQKPRDVLITKAQYMEMLVNQDDISDV